MEKSLEIRLVIKDASEFDVEIYEPESGDFTRLTNMFSPDEHPVFNEQIGNEIYAWISMLMDEYDEPANKTHD